MKQYDHKKLEKKWQTKWLKDKIYKTQDKEGKPKCYILDMFPYPSGEGLHVGHPKGYIATDIYSRYKRMTGHNVLHPMGWDAFGLPAENYAIKNKIVPQTAVTKNIKRFKKQLDIIGLDYDWSREVNTTDPKFYKWTQWAFLKMFEKGLAYESYEPINWCPSCKTGLANEDLEDGKCERCGTPVEKKPLRQWVLRITKYADRLLKDLDTLDWPESIKESQRNWIGRSEGASLSFDIKNSNKKIEVFTTRPDTLFGVTYVVIAPENPLVEEFLASVKNKQEVIDYVAKARMMTEIERTDAKKEKTGVEMKGVVAINPATKEEVPVWVADYVLASYGTGAVMAVPAHDERDWDFAKKFGLGVKQVVAVYATTKDGKDAVRKDKETIKRKTVYALLLDEKNNKFMCLDWEKFGWHSGIIGGVDEDESYVAAAMREIKEETGYIDIEYVRDLGMVQHNHFFAAHKDVNRYAFGQGMLFRLKSHQKNETKEEDTQNHKTVWIDEVDMGNWLNLSAFQYMWKAYKNNTNCFTEEGVLINSNSFDNKNSEEVRKEITLSVGGQWVSMYKLHDWVFSRQRYWGEPIPLIHCEKCGVVPVPEKDLPVLLPKVKYYEPTGTGESPLAGIEKWVNVKCPKCKGKAKRETNTMPQWAGSSWYYLRYIDPKNTKSLIDKNKDKYWSSVDIYVGGAEHATRHLIYARFWHKFLYDIGVVNYIEPFKNLKNQGLIMSTDGRKMSKRFGNVVNPDDVIVTYGADTLRVYESFMGPFENAINWNTDSMIGSRRFLERVWKLGFKVTKNGDDIKYKNSKLESLVHKTVEKVDKDILSFAMNTAVSSMMILLNEMETEEKITRNDFEMFLKILAPFAPHITDELWGMLGNKKSIHIEKWPVADRSKIGAEAVTVVVQVNGKMRGTFETEQTTTEDNLKQNALALPEVKKWIEGKEIKKIICVKNKLVNIVVA